MPDYQSRQQRKEALKKQNNKKPGKKSGGNSGGIFKRIVMSIALILIICLVAGGAAVASILAGAPDVNKDELSMPVASKMYFDDGKNSVTLDGNINRIPVKVDEVPDIIKQAFIATEDNRFYHHYGIDPIRIVGAAIANLKNGFGAEGGSTITQQLVKMDLLTSKKTLPRKIQEAYLSIKVEQKYTKDEILNMYMNRVYMGERVNGVATAAKVYYGLDVDELDKITIPQAAMLAGLVQAPSAYDPLRNPDRAKERRDLVLNLMAKNGVITDSEAEKAKKVSIKEMTKNHEELKGSSDAYDAAIDYVTRELKEKGLIDSEKDLYSSGLKIYTTIDSDMQKHMVQVLDSKELFSGLKDNFEAAATTVDTQTGAVKAVGGQRNYHDSYTNYAIEGRNSVGSTAKPLIDYGPAIEYLKWPTSHILVDEKHTYTGTDIVIGEWDGRYWGAMTIKRALEQSRNVPAVKALQAVEEKVGKDKAVDFANKLGLGIEPEKFNESYALGSFSSSPLKIAAAYAAFGNGGTYHEPHAVTKVVYPDGRTKELDYEKHPAMHDYTAYMITDMLRGVVTSGTADEIGAALPGYPIAGKTGSTQIPPDYEKQYGVDMSGTLDEWFTGYTPKYTTSVWTGYSYVNPDEYKKMSAKEKEKVGLYLPDGRTSESKAAHMHTKLFTEIMKDYVSKGESFNKPDSVVSVKVEKDTGLKASAGTPSSQVMDALFVKGTAPEKVSDKYRTLDAPSAFKAEYDKDKQRIHLSWNAPSADLNSGESLVYEVAGDGGFSKTTSDTSVDVDNIEPGKSYTFKVKASVKEGSLDSGTATVTIKVPDEGQKDNKGKDNKDQDNKEKDKKQQDNKDKKPKPDDQNGKDKGTKDGKNVTPPGNENNNDPNTDSTDNTDNKDNNTDTNQKDNGTANDSTDSKDQNKTNQ